MSAITAVRRQMKEMSDGTIRVFIDIDMHCKDDFLASYPIDTPIAIARLTQQASTAIAQEETIAKERVTGLALLAVQWCQDEKFLEWANEENEAGAKLFICEVCHISSRKELNTNTQAASIFQQEIRAPYMQYLHQNGLGQV